MKLSVDLPPELVEAVAERVVELLAEREPIEPDAWLNVQSAAEHLDCPPSRLYALVSARRVPFEKDGSRVLFRRSELDAFVRHGGAVRP